MSRSLLDNSLEDVNNKKFKLEYYDNNIILGDEIEIKNNTANIPTLTEVLSFNSEQVETYTRRKNIQNFLEGYSTSLIIQYKNKFYQAYLSD